MMLIDTMLYIDRYIYHLKAKLSQESRIFGSGSKRNDTEHNHWLNDSATQRFHLGKFITFRSWEALDRAKDTPTTTHYRFCF